MKLDKAVAALEAASARKRVRVAEVEAKADRLRTKLRQSRQREAPRRRWLAPDIIRMAVMAGEGRSAGEIAEAIGGTTRYRVAAALSKHGIALVPKRAAETCVRLTVPRTVVAALARVAVDRDVAPEVLIADALAVLAAEPVVLSNLLDDAE